MNLRLVSPRHAGALALVPALLAIGGYGSLWLHWCLLWAAAICLAIANYVFPVLTYLALRAKTASKYTELPIEMVNEDVVEPTASAGGAAAGRGGQPGLDDGSRGSLTLEQGGHAAGVADGSAGGGGGGGVVPPPNASSSFGFLLPAWTIRASALFATIAAPPPAGAAAALTTSGSGTSAGSAAQQRRSRGSRRVTSGGARGATAAPLLEESDGNDDDDDDESGRTSGGGHAPAVADRSALVLAGDAAGAAGASTDGGSTRTGTACGPAGTGATSSGGTRTVASTGSGSSGDGFRKPPAHQTTLRDIGSRSTMSLARPAGAASHAAGGRFGGDSASYAGTDDGSLAPPAIDVAAGTGGGRYSAGTAPHTGTAGGAPRPPPGAAGRLEIMDVRSVATSGRQSHYRKPLGEQSSYRTGATSWQSQSTGMMWDPQALLQWGFPVQPAGMTAAAPDASTPNADQAGYFPADQAAYYPHQNRATSADPASAMQQAEEEGYAMALPPVEALRRPPAAAAAAAEEDTLSLFGDRRPRWFCCTEHTFALTALFVACTVAIATLAIQVSFTAYAQSSGDEAQ